MNTASSLHTLYTAASVYMFAVDDTALLCDELVEDEADNNGDEVDAVSQRIASFFRAAVQTSQNLFGTGDVRVAEWFQ